MAPRRRRALLVAGLLLLAPTVGEFLLGNVPISQYPMVFVLVPLYGAGALLVRECARRLGAGWPTIALFAAAYALIEEGPVDQMIFNPGYLGLDSFAGFAEIPGLGISGTLLVFSLALHTVWSICVPIALVEAFTDDPRAPWLGPVGLALSGLVFVGGCVFLGIDQAHEFDFVGTPLQFGLSTVVIVVLLAAGVAARGPRAAETGSRPAPRPWRVGLAAFAVTSAYWLSTGLPGALSLVLCPLAAVLLSVHLVRRWAARDGWDGRHRLALAAGACATYALWFGPSQAGELGTSPAETALGAVVFGVLVLLVVVAAARHQRRLVSSPRRALRTTA